MSRLSSPRRPRHEHPHESSSGPTRAAPRARWQVLRLGCRPLAGEATGRAPLADHAKRLAPLDGGCVEERPTSRRAISRSRTMAAAAHHLYRIELDDTLGSCQLVRESNAKLPGTGVPGANLALDQGEVVHGGPHAIGMTVAMACGRRRAPHRAVRRRAGPRRRAAHVGERRGSLRAWSARRNGPPSASRSRSAYPSRPRPRATRLRAVCTGRVLPQGIDERCPASRRGRAAMLELGPGARDTNAFTAAPAPDASTIAPATAWSRRRGCVRAGSLADASCIVLPLRAPTVRDAAMCCQLSAIS